ncbi:glycosyltransferase [Glaciihabitans arcticus]|uniref:Glycosyltransferase n=1 Tax=Glaciihabitans arcticus TaxID=2668039 RepID=A0A4Q9GW06_9MICO|nr:glycosyltransferase [Glaciihabitans arcticus]
MPRVTVLLATHNGARWIDEQLDTILAQTGVEVRVIALDDASTDTTVALLEARAASDPRLTILTDPTPAGGAAANFYRLLRRVDFTDAGLVAFADQDDVWLPGKLARHAELLAAGADGVSSDVTAFSEGGPRELVRKSYPQREFDYLLESPGPGCTFLMSNRLVTLAQQQLADPESDASRADFHDWLLYVLCRARGWNWVIDDAPSVDYRQHGSNAMGANLGAASAKRRLGLIGNRWHRGEATLLARAGLAVASDSTRPGLERMLDLFERTGPSGRVALLGVAGQLRRRSRDRAIIGTLVALGIW